MSCCPTCGRPMPPSKLIVNLDTGTVTHGMERARFSPTQTEILHALAQASGGFLTHERLGGAVWGLASDVDERENLRQHLWRMKPKLRRLGVEIVNERGRGYTIQVMTPTEARP